MKLVFYVPYICKDQNRVAGLLLRIKFEIENFLDLFLSNHCLFMDIIDFRCVFVLKVFQVSFHIYLQSLRWIMLIPILPQESSINDVTLVGRVRKLLFGINSTIKQGCLEGGLEISKLRLLHLGIPPQILSLM